MLPKWQLHRNLLGEKKILHFVFNWAKDSHYVRNVLQDFAKANTVLTRKDTVDAIFLTHCYNEINT